jgi:CBS domain containing-hemolysin-like protein
VSLWGNRYVGVISAMLTLIILIFSEIIPKTLGARFWRQLAPLTVRFCDILIVVMAPLVWLSDAVTRLLGKESSATITRREFVALAAVGAREGQLAAEESSIMENLLKLRMLKVHDIMTPRTVMVAAHGETTVADFLEKHPRLPVSRIPIYNENADDVIGLVLKDDVLSEKAHDRHHTTLNQLRRGIQGISESDTVADLFTRFTETGEHLLLVLDGHGGVAGVVTLEDLLETILGREIVDEADLTADMRSIARDKWVDRAERHGMDPDLPGEEEP